MCRQFEVSGSTALVTGANQGIGRGFVEVLLQRGVQKVYATARRAETLADLVSLDRARVVPITLDVTDAAARAAAARRADDVNLLINNAGIPGHPEREHRQLLAARSLDDARQVMETNLWAPVELCRAFAPGIVARGGGAIVNIISIGALFCLPEYSSYSVAKAALAFATAGVRAELSRQNVLVSGVFTGGVKTRMSARNASTVTPVAHAHEVFDALARGEEDIFAGANAPAMRDEIRADPKAFERKVVERFHTAPLGTG
jgi:short-subunit dehydrogenase